MRYLLIGITVLFLSFSCAEKKDVKPVLDQSARLDELILNSVEKMAQNINKSGFESGFEIVLDDIYLENSRVLTPLSYYLKDLIISTTLQTKLFKVIQSMKELNSKKDDMAFVVNDDSDIDGLLVMNYFIEGNVIRLTFKLNKGDSREILFAADTRIDKSLVPDSISYVPGNFTRYTNCALDAPVLAKNDFKTMIWTDKGLNGLYRKDEKMVLKVKSEKDCYVKIYHTDVNGKIQLIFPNNWEQKNFLKANQAYKIPNEKMDFEFEMGAPYGIETIRLVAQTYQFTDLESANFEGSFRQEGNANDSATAKGIYTRGITIKPVKDVENSGPIQFSEAGYTYNIIEK